MAQKKITDLQLVSSITDSANWIIDTGIQTYRATSTQIMTYIYSKLNALSQVTPLAGDNVLLLDASDSNNPKRILFSQIKNSAYRSVTTTDSVGADDETMVLSGASFTSTLPTAVGVAGKKYTFIHNGTTGSQIYTIATTSSQTVGPLASGEYKLYSKHERLELQSDGANWIIVDATSKFCVIEDIKSANTGGGSFTGGSFIKRTLNTISGDNTFASLASDVITLLPGTYDIEFSAPAHSGTASNTIGAHKAKLRNTSDSTDAIIGTSEKTQRINDANLVTTRSIGAGRITITASKNFELQHYAAATSTTGYGEPTNAGVSEVYAQVKIRRI